MRKRDIIKAMQPNKIIRLYKKHNVKPIKGMFKWDDKYCALGVYALDNDIGLSKDYAMEIELENLFGEKEVERFIDGFDDKKGYDAISRLGCKARKAVEKEFGKL